MNETYNMMHPITGMLGAPLVFFLYSDILVPTIENHSLILSSKMARVKDKDKTNKGLANVF